MNNRRLTVGDWVADDNKMLSHKSLSVLVKELTGIDRGHIPREIAELFLVGDDAKLP